MPANLPPQYLKAEEGYRKASSPDSRLEAVREMFRLLPKHKGTEKLQSDLKQKMSQLREEVERGKSGGKKAGVSHRVPSEGAGQVVLVGAPNAGKSSLLAALTNARPEIAAYPYTTRSPQPGIMMWRDVPVQLVDLPPIAPEFFEPWVTSVIRSADAALLVVDLASDDVADATSAVLDRLAEVHTELVGELPYDVEDERIRHLRTVMVANKLDAEGAPDRLEIVRDWLGPRFPDRGGLGADRRRTGNAAGVGIRFTGSAPRLYESPWQTGRSDEAVHDAHRQHRPGSGQGDPPRIRALAEVGPYLGLGGLRWPIRQARSRTARRRCR